VQHLATVDSVSARLETVLTRLSARFRSMPESKLLGRLSADGRSRAAAGHELAGMVALAAQGVEDRARQVPPPWRALPFDGPFVVGDQIGVAGHDLIVACAGVAAVDPAAEVWARTTVGDGPRPRCERVGIEELLRRVLAAAEALAGVL
jgi:hypothetical protein